MFHFRLSAEAYSRLEDLKSVSKASLYYAIEHHKVIFFFTTKIPSYLRIERENRY